MSNPRDELSQMDGNALQTIEMVKSLTGFLQTDKFKGAAIFGLIMGGFALFAWRPDPSSADIPVEGEGAVAPVLVELFTSQGCHSCPPAEAIMNQMIEQDVVLGADIVALQFHVDYWDYLGWKDPYSDEAFSNRQREYAHVKNSSRIYTPQMIVDGQTEFVGSIKNGDFIVTAKSDQVISQNEKLGVYIAITENNLTDDVTSGENRGKTLKHHGVVREFRKLGDLDPNQKLEVEAGTKIPGDWKIENLNAVIFLQSFETRKVAAVAQIAL